MLDGPSVSPSSAAPSGALARMPPCKGCISPEAPNGGSTQTACCGLQQRALCWMACSLWGPRHGDAYVPGALAVPRLILLRKEVTIQKQRARRKRVKRLTANSKLKGSV